MKSGLSVLHFNFQFAFLKLNNMKNPSTTPIQRDFFAWKSRYVKGGGNVSKNNNYYFFNILNIFLTQERPLKSRHPVDLFCVKIIRYQSLIFVLYPRNTFLLKTVRIMPSGIFIKTSKKRKKKNIFMQIKLFFLFFTFSFLINFRTFFM